MRRALLGLTVVGTIAIVALLGPFPTAGAAETLRFRIDFPNSEFSEFEDPRLVTGSFLLKRGGERAGHLNFVCTGTQESPRRDVCWGAIRVKGKGLIIVHGGQSESNEKPIVAITGGTGAYRGAAGVAKLNFRDGVATIEID